MEQQVSAKVSKNMSNDGQATDDRNVSASGPGLAREPDLTQSQALGLTLAVNEDLYTPAHTPYPEKGLMYQARKAFEDLPGAADDRDDDNTGILIDYETSSGHSFEIIGSQTRQILHSMTPAHTEAGEDALDPTIGPELSESDQQPAMPSVDYESSIPGPVQDSSIPSYVPGSSDIEDPAHNNSYERVSITSLLSHVSSSTAQVCATVFTAHMLVVSSYVWI
ncbi:hypothetical protein SARC_04300 [Sphaeroforma arctica JP610]|uniref:Uncharacterized protein n=1 Tax=Sphaeroforma arctica JP610 TaxID=667725 RepID=A0A0L0G3L8_9EUKA|nr:hypothetical protein SARC_04300 [Sphaeroforma arctica JP610]KNC83459.1 hypothetical protein SARC_04300 [Sphaeroforma arctica JP610]|eukprot:XP_014157361.1 hypothetical protein SARC_04300 [Sphaeroforma arctica JP610]